MPEDQNDELTPEQLQLPADVQALLRQGRKAQRDKEVAEAALAVANKATAVAQAGVPDHPAREAVFERYEGPLDAESIRTYATSMGLMAPVNGGGPSAEELEAQRRIASASGGAPPAGSGDIDLAVAMRNAPDKKALLGIIGEVSGDPGFRSRDGLVGELPSGII